MISASAIGWIVAAAGPMGGQGGILTPMARVLVVGYGPQAAGFARRLADRGVVVRLAGPDVEEAGSGVEPVVADPFRLATLSRHLAHVTVGCWLMASGPRLEAFLRSAVDAGVRGIVYQPPAGSHPSTAVAERLAGRYALGFAVVGEGNGWEEQAIAAVDRLLRR